MRTNFAYDTEALWQDDRDHIIHPWIDLGTAKTREPLIIAAAEGVHIYDSRGHRMLDGIGGMWCVNIGYGREEMAQAIADQVRRMPYFSPFGLISTPQSIEFGKRLTAYTPGDLKHVFFATGGSTAVDSALRFVQFYNNFIRPAGEEAHHHPRIRLSRLAPISRRRSPASRAIAAISISSPIRSITSPPPTPIAGPRA